MTQIVKYFLLLEKELVSLKVRKGLIEFQLLCGNFGEKFPTESENRRVECSKVAVRMTGLNGRFAPLLRVVSLVGNSIGVCLCEYSKRERRPVFGI